MSQYVLLLRAVLAELDVLPRIAGDPAAGQSVDEPQLQQSFIQAIRARRFTLLDHRVHLQHQRVQLVQPGRMPQMRSIRDLQEANICSLI